jgi:hypothetical protein
MAKTRGRSPSPNGRSVSRQTRSGCAFSTARDSQAPVLNARRVSQPPVARARRGSQPQAQVVVVKDEEPTGTWEQLGGKLEKKMFEEVKNITQILKFIHQKIREWWFLKFLLDYFAVSDDNMSAAEQISVMLTVLKFAESFMQGSYRYSVWERFFLVCLILLSWSHLRATVYNLIYLKPPSLICLCLVLCRMVFIAYATDLEDDFKWSQIIKLIVLGFMAVYYIVQGFLNNNLFYGFVWRLGSLVSIAAASYITYNNDHTIDAVMMLLMSFVCQDKKIQWFAIVCSTSKIFMFYHPFFTWLAYHCMVRFMQSQDNTRMFTDKDNVSRARRMVIVARPLRDGVDVFFPEIKSDDEIMTNKFHPFTFRDHGRVNVNQYTLSMNLALLAACKADRIFNA